MIVFDVTVNPGFYFAVWFDYFVKYPMIWSISSTKDIIKWNSGTDKQHDILLFHLIYFHINLTSIQNNLFYRCTAGWILLKSQSWL